MSITIDNFKTLMSYNFLNSHKYLNNVRVRNSKLVQSSIEYIIIISTIKYCWRKPKTFKSSILHKSPIKLILLYISLYFIWRNVKYTFLFRFLYLHISLIKHGRTAGQYKNGQNKFWEYQSVRRNNSPQCPGIKPSRPL